MILMFFFACLGLLNVSDVMDEDYAVDAFLVSLVSTFGSIKMNLTRLFTESDALLEDRLEHLLNRLQSFLGWIPFGQRLEKNLVN
jgi:hypothetical protein